jgi:hypothetical protein
VSLTGALSLQEIVEDITGNDAIYTPHTGDPVALRGIKKTRRERFEDIAESVGRIDTEHRFKLQRALYAIADFPADPDPRRATYGKLEIAGQTHAVVGVAHERTAHLSLFLSDPT